MLRDEEALQLVLRAQALRSNTAATLLRLLADYVAQAQDEVQSLAAATATSSSSLSVATTAHSNRRRRGGDNNSRRRYTTTSSGDCDDESSSDDDDDEVVAVQRELRDVHARVQRMATLLRLLQQWHNDSTHTLSRGGGGDSNKGDSTTRGSSASRLVDDALCALQAMCTRLRGVATTTTAAAAADDGNNAYMSDAFADDAIAAVVSSTSPRLSRIGTPTSLAEASLELYAGNTTVLHRRDDDCRAAAAAVVSNTGKRIRDGDAAKEDDDDDDKNSHASDGELAACVPDMLRELSRAQRAQRRRLYSAQEALLPPRVANALAPLYVSPAVRSYARADAYAEEQMLWQAWCVHTKANLLRELPRLHDVVRGFRDELHNMLQQQQQQREEGDEPEQQHTASSSGQHVFFVVEACHGGVVRVCVQRGLYVDVTYDMRRKTWVLLQLHWNVWTSASAMTATALLDEAVAAAAGDDGDDDDGDTRAGGTATLRRVQPSHGDAMRRFLQRRFVDDGFAGGCVAANRLLCCVVLDVAAQQLAMLRDDVFVGPLRSLYALDVRAGTHVACRLTAPLPPPPPPQQQQQPLPSCEHAAVTGNNSNNNSGNTVAANTVVHLKCSMACGTVVLELRGDDAQSCDDEVRVLLSPLPHVPPPLQGGVVVDMEQLLWDKVLTRPQPLSSSTL